MPRKSLGVLAAVVVLVSAVHSGWPAMRPERAEALTNCSTTEEALNPSELQMLQLINGARANAGLKQLKVSPNLNRAAAWKSADRSASPPLSHTDSLGRAPFARAVDCGYPSGMAENIAWGYPSAQAAFDAWMGSPGHRANILTSYYVVIGLGLVGAAWTTDFGLEDDSGSGGSPPPTAPPAPTATPPPPPTRTSEPLPPPPSATNPPATQPPASTPAPTAQPRPGTSVDLHAGVNIVTYGGPRQPAATALASVRGGLLEAYLWNNELQRWERFTLSGPGYVNTFSEFAPGRVYYLRLAFAATWVY